MVRPFDVETETKSLFDALLDAAEKYGKDKIIIEDQERQPVSYNEFILRTFIIARLFDKVLHKETRIGLMLPTSMGGALSFFGLHARGRTPVMINFTAGPANIKTACLTGKVKTVITSRRFVTQAKLEDIVASLTAYVRVLYLEDLRKTLSLPDKLYGLAASKLPRVFAHKAKPSDIGVILFTSGSFGTPRGVVLTQANLVLNCAQIAAHIELKPEWVAFNPMPIFHSLGLTGGVILPLLQGLKSFQYPSPLHVKQIPGLLKETKASLLFSTDTFLNQYARASQPDDFATLEFVVCGAEKVREETHKLFREQFNGLTVLEGYGVTETSPVLAVNYPHDNRHGTVGHALPGMQLRLEMVEGINEGGRLHVKGPNIMGGYINLETPDIIEAPKDGWHDTGDIVSLDKDGFIKILGRAKRFAKIAGEMVSLTAVERIAEEVWPDNRHAVVAVADDKKGERLVLITDHDTADLSQLADWAKDNGTPALAIPKKLVKVETVPVLGSGKTDYITLQKLAEVVANAA
ncbi:AMP-binding protein [Asticcacaulis sp. YBE204]|uniref:AMP-binding protein n=1 Tax=Asticcacaulis sp. YBE204 TaxID=1282363 RepID=UPI0003C3C131|nr:AMP-binding protein [Asticcacaulis sp. YBE204]ESQ78110.1 Aas bifunctional protein [Asticcacaulis sp. YBE204]